MPPLASLNFDLESVLGLLRQRQPAPFVLQIGAMDGVRFDPLFPIVTAGGWRGLIVEPLPDLYRRLVDNHRGHSGFEFVNVAVTEAKGVRPIYRVDPEAIRDGRTPDWAVGISSFFNDRNSLGGVLTSPPKRWLLVEPGITRGDMGEHVRIQEEQFGFPITSDEWTSVPGEKNATVRFSRACRCARRTPGSRISMPS